MGRHKKSEGRFHTYGTGQGFGKGVLDREAVGKSLLYDYTPPKKVDTEFDSVIQGGVLTVDNPKVWIPQEILDTCANVQGMVGSDEFSILVKGTWGEINKTVRGFIISRNPEDVYVPKQEVSGGSVKYLEPLQLCKNQGFNTVIHSHPFSGAGGAFSGIDETYINAFMPCSILYAGRTFPAATLLYEIPDGHARYPAEPKIFYYPNLTINENLKKMVEERVKKWASPSKLDPLYRYPRGLYPFGRDYGEESDLLPDVM